MSDAVFTVLKEVVRLAEVYRSGRAESHDFAVAVGALVSPLTTYGPSGARYTGSPGSLFGYFAEGSPLHHSPEATAAVQELAHQPGIGG